MIRMRRNTARKAKTLLAEIGGEYPFGLDIQLLKTVISGSGSPRSRK